MSKIKQSQVRKIAGDFWQNSLLCAPPKFYASHDNDFFKNWYVTFYVLKINASSKLEKFLAHEI